MSVRNYILLLAISLTVSASARAQAIVDSKRLSEQLKNLDGEWIAVEGVSGGQKLKKEELAEVKMLFSYKHSQCSMRLGPSLVPPKDRPSPPGRSVSFNVNLQPTISDPALCRDHLMLMGPPVGMKGTAYQGIYEQKGETLRVCLDLSLGVGERGGLLALRGPYQFEAEPLSGFTLLTLKKVKK